MAYFLIILTSFIWGTAFVSVKWSIIRFSALESNALRFFITAILAFIILLIRKKLTLDWKKLKPALFAALVLITMLVLQTWGLEYTTVAKSGFLTTLYAFFTPLLTIFIYKNKLKIGYWILMSIALIGIFMLGEMEFSNFNFGDFLTVLCSLCAAIHILIVEYYAPEIESSLDFNMYQCLFLGLICVGFLPFIGIEFFSRIPYMEAKEWGSYFYLSVFSSLIAFSTQAWAQKQIPSHIVSMLYLLESPFAAIAGFLLVGETMSMIGIIGCVFILISVSLVPKFMNAGNNTTS
jgi:drug/metabolite transporter (DMT)-like permease